VKSNANTAYLAKSAARTTLPVASTPSVAGERLDMNAPETQPSVPPPSPPFQFSLRTLLLLFVVLGSSLGVFGAWGIVVFGMVVGLGIYFP